MGPTSASMRATASAEAFGSETSNGAMAASTPSAFRPAAARSSLALSRPLSTMRAPALPSPPASARPMPWLEPVTRATRPVRSNKALLMMVLP